MSLRLRNIILPLTDFTLEVNVEMQSRVTVLFGPSGAGKTTLLDLVAGFRRARSAFIQLDGQVLTDTDKRTFVPTRDRGIGYVPQDLALFPHLSVRQNLLYGRKREHMANKLFRVEHVAEVLEIEALIQRRVTQLSGGEKQRVALARALLASPSLLLLDEPLASLDRKLKERIIPYLGRVRDEFGLPMLYVTHDRFEALTIADAVVVLVNGKVMQTGRVEEVFGRPATLEVADLLTIETIQPGRIIKTGEGLVEVAVGSTRLFAIDQKLPPNAREVFVCIRAEDVILQKAANAPTSARNHLAGVIQSITREGAMMRVEMDCGFRLAALLTKQACDELVLRPGDRVVTLIKAPNIHLIAR